MTGRIKGGPLIDSATRLYWREDGYDGWLAPGAQLAVGLLCRPLGAHSNIGPGWEGPG